MVLSVLKFTAIVLSGLFAFAALLGENRDANRRLTIWGKMAFIGVVSSTLVAVLIQGVENLHAAEESDRTQLMITEIQRAAYPLVPVRAPTFSYQIDLPLDTNPRLAAYRTRLREMTSELKAHKGRSTWRGIRASSSAEIKSATERSTKKTETVIGLSFKANSPPAFPTAETEAALWDWITHLGLDIEFTSAKSIAAAKEQGKANARPDLTMRQICDPESLDFEYLYDEDSLAIRCAGGLERDALKTSTGVIASLSDLAGAQMSISFRDENRSDALDLDRFEIEKRARLVDISFVIANRRFTPSQELKESKDSNGFQFYNYTMPAVLFGSDQD